MGTVNSSLSELSANSFLVKLSSPDHISLNDTTFWDGLLNFKPSFSGYGDVKEMHSMEENVSELLHQLIRHSLHVSSGGNLGVLVAWIQVHLSQYLKHQAAIRAKSNQVDKKSSEERMKQLTQLSNALFILRCAIKSSLEHMTSLSATRLLSGDVHSRDDFILRLLYRKEMRVDSEDTSTPAQTYGQSYSDVAVERKLDQMRAESRSHLENFLSLLVTTLAEEPVNDATYHLHLECVNTVITLFCDVLYRPRCDEVSLPLQLCIFEKPSQQAEQLMTRLLQNFIAQRDTPKHLLSSWYKSSMLYDATAYVASSLWSVLTLGQGSTSQTATVPERLLATQSCLLVLILCNHCASNTISNPYRAALFDYPGKAFVESEMQVNKRFFGEAEKTQARLSRQSTLIQALLQTLADTMGESEFSVLLFYLLYHRNGNVRTFFVQQPSATITLRDEFWDKLTLPLLYILYKHGNDHSHRVYMSLILLLLLTEDDEYNTRVHDIMLKKPPTWFTELTQKTSGGISLGSVLVLLLVRTIQCHVTQINDKYLHTNCLATLANMSSRISKLHPVVCRKLVNLLHNLHRRHLRLVERLRNESARGCNVGTAEPSTSVVIVQISEVDSARISEEIAVLEEMTRMILEIVNSVLCHCIHTNPHLVYTLLSQRDACIVPLRSYAPCQDLVKNIDSILTFFLSRLTKEVKGDPTEHDVMDIIKKHSSTVSRHQGFKRFPELRFKYMEEESPEEFFVPYVWSLVFQQSGLHFNASKIQLFSWPKSDSTSGQTGTSSSSTADKGELTAVVT